MLDAGEIDTVAHQMSITPERLEKYNFCEPYAYSYYDFAVKNDSTIATKEDLKGKKVGCWLGGNGEKTLRDANEKYGLNLDIVTFDGAPIEKEVELGRIDACWQGEIKTMSTRKENNLPLKMIGEKLTFETNAYPFAKTEKAELLAKEVSDTVNAMREDGTLVAQLFCLYFGILPMMSNITLKVSSFGAALIVMNLNSSAYMAESLRGAIVSVDKGQMEAALSIGMSYIQAMKRVILPQAFRVALPTLCNSFINVLKDTSLTFYIGVKEMMATAQLEAASSYRYLEAFVDVLIIYWILTSILGHISKKLEKKMNKMMGEQGFK